MLVAEGIEVARRTVAKYRESMGFPSSNERRRVAIR
jgi:RNA polymerase sigma-54 factor